MKLSHTYSLAGNFAAALTVKDTSGATNSNSANVLILPAPVANAGGPYVGKTGQSISFNGSASTAPPGQLLAYNWNFGDNGTATGVTPTHTYNSSGTFTVTLSVTDSSGGTNSNSTTATITAGPGPGDTEQASSSMLFAVGPATSNEPRFAYVATSSAPGENVLSAMRVDAATGELEPTSLQPLSPASPPTLSGMTFDPSGKFLYLYGGNTIVNFVADPVTGTLTQQETIVTIGNVGFGRNQAFAFHPGGKFAFLATTDPNRSDLATSDIVTAYKVNPINGALSSTGIYSAQVAFPETAVVEPAGAYLYVAGTEAGMPDANPEISGFSSTHSSISAFSIDANTGALNPVPGSPFSTKFLAQGTTMAVDPSGRFLFVAGSTESRFGPSLSVFSIDKGTGKINEISGSPFSLGEPSYASSIEFDPSGRHAYILTGVMEMEGFVREDIQTFSLDDATGTPTLVSTLKAAATGPDSTGWFGGIKMNFSGGLAQSIPPDGRDSSASNPPDTRGIRLYYANASDRTISIFSVNSQTGVLLPTLIRK